MHSLGFSVSGEVWRPPASKLPRGQAPPCPGPPWLSTPTEAVYLLGFSPLWCHFPPSLHGGIRAHRASFASAPVQPFTNAVPLPSTTFSFTFYNLYTDSSLNSGAPRVLSELSSHLSSLVSGPFLVPLLSAGLGPGNKESEKIVSPPTRVTGVLMKGRATPAGRCYSRLSDTVSSNLSSVLLESHRECTLSDKQMCHLLHLGGGGGWKCTIS